MSIMLTTTTTTIIIIITMPLSLLSYFISHFPSIFILPPILFSILSPCSLTLFLIFPLSLSYLLFFSQSSLPCSLICLYYSLFTYISSIILCFTLSTSLPPPSLPPPSPLSLSLSIPSSFVGFDTDAMGEMSAVLLFL